MLIVFKVGKDSIEKFTNVHYNRMRNYEVLGVF